MIDWIYNKAKDNNLYVKIEVVEGIIKTKVVRRDTKEFFETIFNPSNTNRITEFNYKVDFETKLMQLLKRLPN